MIRYILSRIAQSILVIFLTYTFVFVLLNVLPSDPISLRFAEIATPGSEDYERLSSYYGYDQPLWVQYFTQLGQLVRGNLGYSLENGAPVLERITSALPSTIALTGLTLVIAVIAALLAGLLAFSRWGTWVVTLVRSIPPITSALPVYWTGIVFIQVGSYQLGLFAALGTDGFPALLAASISLAIPISAAITQAFVSSIGEFVSSPFVEVATARGASNLDIFTRYGIRAVAIPTLTVIAITFGTLMTSTIVTETVFARSGVGSLVQRAVLSQDIPVVQGIVLFAAVLFITVNLLVDLAALAIDPRLRAPAGRRARKAAVPTVAEAIA